MTIWQNYLSISHSFQRVVKTAVVTGWAWLKLIRFHSGCSLKQWGLIQRAERQSILNENILEVAENRAIRLQSLE